MLVSSAVQSVADERWLLPRNSIAAGKVGDDEAQVRKVRFRPPKKRLSDSGCDVTKSTNDSTKVHDAPTTNAGLGSNPPTLEELWRQSMKFREEVMADFSKSKLERRKGQSQLVEESSMKGSSSTNSNSSSGRAEVPGVGDSAKHEFKNKRHKTKARKDRSKSKDRDANNRRRPPVASTDLVSIAGGGCAELPLMLNIGAVYPVNVTGRKRKRNSADSSPTTQHHQPSNDGNGGRNGVQIISKETGDNYTTTPKLIIRFGKIATSTACNDIESPPAAEKTGPAVASANKESQNDVSDDVTSPPPLQKLDGTSQTSGSVTTLRLMPIKLKLARGSRGYVTKTKLDSTPPPSPMPTPKESCQVR